MINRNNDILNSTIRNFTNNSSKAGTNNNFVLKRRELAYLVLKYEDFFLDFDMANLKNDYYVNNLFKKKLECYNKCLNFSHNSTIINEDEEQCLKKCVKL